MERAKQLILVIVNDHFVRNNAKGLIREYVEDFHHFTNILKGADAQLGPDKSERLKKFVNERTDVLNKATCDKKFVQDTYDMLFTILQNLSTEEVWKCFHELTGYYWNALKTKYDQADLDLIDVFPADTFEGLVKVTWPYVKIDYIASKMAEGKGNNEVVEELLDAVDEYLQKPSLLREDCHKIVENQVGSKNFKLLSYDLKFLEERPGYLGDYFRTRIAFRDQRGEDQVLNLFAKCLPTTQFLPMALAAFPKEDFFYGEFMPRVKELDFRGIDGFMPRCYFTRKSDVIVMEDVSLQGYSGFERRGVPELQLASLIVRALAKMHSSSLMLEEKMSTKLRIPYRLDTEYYDYIQETMFTHTMFSGLTLTCATRTIYEYLLDKFPEVPKGIPMRIFKRRVEYLIRRTFIDTRKSSKFRNSVNHGDLWNGNFLLSREEDTGKLKSCLLIDFQLVRYQPPALDVLFFIYFNKDLWSISL